jgi:hypothetical protein
LSVAGSSVGEFEALLSVMGNFTDEVGGLFVGATGADGSGPLVGLGQPR